MEESEKKELFDTKGIDLLQVVKDAKENGNGAFAEEVERQIANVQTCYDIVAQKHTSTAGENIWNIDVEELKARLK